MGWSVTGASYLLVVLGLSLGAIKTIALVSVKPPGLPWTVWLFFAWPFSVLVVAIVPAFRFAKVYALFRYSRRDGRPLGQAELN
jgi:hypothetical protein